MSQEPFHKYPIKLDPFFSQRPWAGDRLRTALGKNIEKNARIGESWELSDHPDGRSRIANGSYAGWFFGDLFQEHFRGMCDLESAEGGFPLLVKYVDAGQDLSLQVHPADLYASQFSDRGKNECWYVMDCHKGAEIICGLQDDVAADDLRRGALIGRIEDLIRRIPIRKGSFVYLPAGTVHAILGGTLVCEIQQSSNLTYRLWDWDRKPLRELHLDHAIAVTLYGNGNTPRVIETAEVFGELKLLANPHFEVDLLGLSAFEKLTHDLKDNRHGVILNVIAGGGDWKMEDLPDDLQSGSFQLGDTWFLPAGIVEMELKAASNGLRLLITRCAEFEKHTPTANNLDTA